MESPSRPVKTPNKRLFIGGLPFRYSEGQLLELFAPFGRIISLRIIKNQWGKSRGIGYVEFDELRDAQVAKQKLHNHRVAEDRTIIVDYAQPDPFNTLEGQQRHVDALVKKGLPADRQGKFHPEMAPVIHPDRDLTDTTGSSPSPQFSNFSAPSTGRSFKKRPGLSHDKKSVAEGKVIPPNRGNHLRQSVFLSRYHGSKVGAKFAARSKFKKSR